MNARELLIAGAEELGTPLTSEQVNLLFIFLAELKKWNRRINLTAIRGERDTIVKHVLDSLAYLKGFTPLPGLKLLDMGSGAGFPAIPLKIACPDISVTLVESVKKKAAFLRHIVRTLSLADIRIVDARTEELGKSNTSSYDVVTARAFADMNAALSAGIVFLKPEGLIVLSRGPEENITDQELVIKGIRVRRKIELKLPQSDYNRMVWVFNRRSP